MSDNTEPKDEKGIIEALRLQALAIQHETRELNRRVERFERIINDSYAGGPGVGPMSLDNRRRHDLRDRNEDRQKEGSGVLGWVLLFSREQRWWAIVVFLLLFALGIFGKWAIDGGAQEYLQNQHERELEENRQENIQVLRLECLKLQLPPDCFERQDENP